MKRFIAPLVVSLILAACGGGGDESAPPVGGGGGGGGGGTTYTISVNPTSVSVNGISGSTPALHQIVNATFNGAGVVVGTLPGQTLPTWLSVSAAPVSNSPAAIDISFSPANLSPGTYTTTLRFVTGNAAATSVVFVDLPITFTVVQGQQVSAHAFGMATGSQVSASLNGGAPTTLTGTPTPLGLIASGTNYTVNIPAQPPGQNCSWPNGSATQTGTIVNSFQVLLRVTCNASLIGWTWVGGSQVTGDASVYGTRGIPAPGNTPGGRAPAAYAQDAAGNLWMFGGRDEAGFLHNDLWRYDIATGLWTWVSGSGAPNVGATYGTLNTPSSSNVPGARFGSVAWIDGSGNFWLFGGDGFLSPGLPDSMNDLWMYNVATDAWTWVGGSSTGTNGGLGTYGTSPSTSNIPGYRYNASVAKDAAGNVWIFGGIGAGEINSSGRMNDLWKFTPSTRVWEWISGANEPVQTRVQGTLGVPNAANYPVGRDSAATWIDNAGDFWMFGGSAINGFENDLWRYSPGNDMWTWMGGADRTNPSVATSPGTYNAPGSANNYPASRASASSWTDASGNFWLFGGYGQTPDFQVSGLINDLWKYSPSTNTWSWLSGSSAQSSPSIRGTQGVAANTNVPSSRNLSAAWRDSTGRLWLWGGPTAVTPSGFASDVWRVTPQ